MRKTIPETYEWYCDRCNVKIPERKILCKGSLKFINRDILGGASTSEVQEIDLCESCSFYLQKFLGGKEVPKLKPLKAKMPQNTAK